MKENVPVWLIQTVTNTLNSTEKELRNVFLHLAEVINDTFGGPLFCLSQ